MESVLVAYSGGADSTLLAAVAKDVLGTKALAVTAKSPSLATEELDDAVETARALGLNHRVIETGEVDRADYKANDPNRCYFCKEELYTHLAALAATEGYECIANGHNMDDQGDFRPGINSARRRGIRSPLVEAGLTKAEVRELSRRLGLSTWDKPAQACLSSRVPYGTPITIEALQRIAKAEAYLRSLGVRQARVRHHDTIARIEVAPEDFPALLAPDARQALTRHFKGLGYAYVTLDMDGFRSGSMNEVYASLQQKAARFQAE